MKRCFWLVTSVVIGLALLGAACGDTEKRTEKPSPIPPSAPTETVILAAPTQTPGGPTPTPSPTLPPTITPTNTPLPGSPTGTPSPTDLPGPYEHVIQEGEYCLGIAYKYGHTHPDVKRAIEALNNMSDCGLLPAPGNTILIPRPTFTPTPVGADLTQTAVATSAPPMMTVDTSANYSVQAYMVQDGDTLSSIAIIHDTSLRQLCELNPLPGGFDCGGCTWESPNCCCPRPPVLSVGQEIKVPAPTPTPTFTPTFTGSETPTFTPMHRAPQPIYPSDGASIAGPVRLTWLTVGVLADDEYYVIMVRDETTGAVYNDSTRQLSLDIPPEYLPSDEQARTFIWQVAVARLGDDGLFYPTGSVMPEQGFIWRGWQ